MLSCRIRTEFSFRKATGKLEKVFDRLVELKADHFPISDISSTFGFTQWNQLCKKNNKHPVFAVDIFVSTSLTGKRNQGDLWTFVAKDSIAPLNELLKLATGQFKYQPIITLEQALEPIEAGELNAVAGYRSALMLEDVQWPKGLFWGLSPALSRGGVQDIEETGQTLRCLIRKPLPPMNRLLGNLIMMLTFIISWAAHLPNTNCSRNTS